MKRLWLIAAAWLLFVPAGRASPLADFSPGRWALDLSAKPLVFQGERAAEWGVTAGLGNGWALAGRQTVYDVFADPGRYRTRNSEVNLVRRASGELQIFAGWSHTSAGARGGALALPGKNVAQIGVIGRRELNDRLTLYVAIGGGLNMANIEFGLSYCLRPGLEATGTYRHLTAEKVGPARVKENFRGFGLGFTLKF